MSHPDQDSSRTQPNTATSRPVVELPILDHNTATTRAIWMAIKHADQYGQPTIADALFEILERRVQRSMGLAGPVWHPTNTD